jgi:hypothetical protein
MVERTPIVTLRYQGGPPPPHPPVTEPTPEEEYQMHEAQRTQALQQKESAQAVAETAPAPAGGGGAFWQIAKMASKVANTVEKVGSDVHSAGEAKVRALVQQQNQDRYARSFPEIVAMGDTLICDFTCRVMSQGVKVTGSLQLTNRHLLFVSDTLKEIIPLQEIASIQRSIALETVDNGPPFIMPVPAPHVMPDTLQVFTSKMQVFQFLTFESAAGKAGQIMTSTIKGRPIDRCYNFVDHIWRAAVPVPVPGIQYAQY